MTGADRRGGVERSQGVGHPEGGTGGHPSDRPKVTVTGMNYCSLEVDPDTVYVLFFVAMTLCGKASFAIGRNTAKEREKKITRSTIPYSNHGATILVFTQDLTFVDPSAFCTMASVVLARHELFLCSTS